MTASEFLIAYRESKNAVLLSRLAYIPSIENYSYTVEETKESIGIPGTYNSEIHTDKNLSLRTEITEELLNDFSLNDIDLIRFMYDEESKFTYATTYHHNLHQLSYYLYSLQQLEDVFRIYKAKYKTRSMDAGCMLDRHMLTMRHNINDVIAFAQHTFQEKPSLIEENNTLLEELFSLKEDCAYDSEEEYFSYISGYFSPQAQNTPEQLNSQEHNKNTESKHWWKFW